MQSLEQTNTQKLEELRKTLDDNMAKLQEANGKKLDEFIATDATVVTADNAAERRAEVQKRLEQ